jgi:hypothetical protein
LEAVYFCFVITTFIPIFYLLFLDYRKEKKIYRPYVFTLVGITFYTLAIAPMGKWDWWIDICHGIIGKGM